MSVLRSTLLLLLLVILASLLLFAVQNLSPSLSLVFLGIQTQALPLAVWMLAAVALGVATTLVIAALLRLSNYFVARQARQSARITADRPTPTPKADVPKVNAPKITQPSAQMPQEEDIQDSFTPRQPASPPSNSNDGFVEDDETYASTADFKRVYRSSTPYTTRQEPTTRIQPDSSYSYSYREPPGTGVGKAQSIYDAEYRVIIPPYQAPAPEPPSSEDDDWGLTEAGEFEDGFEDDEFDD